MLSFYQVTSVIATTYSVELPSFYREWTRSFTWIGDIDWSGVAVPTSCVVSSFQSVMILRATGPLILMLATLAGSAISHVWRPASSTKRKPGAADDLKLHQVQDPFHGLSSQLRILFTGIPFVLVIAFVFVPSVTSAIFRARSCVGVWQDDETQAKEFFLRADLSIRCYDSAEHSRLVSLMWLFVSIWPVGVSRALRFGELRDRLKCP